MPVYNIYNYYTVYAYNIDSLLCFVEQMKFLATNGHKYFNTNAISMVISHNQNKYHRIRHRNVGKHYKNFKNTSHNYCQCLSLYKLAKQSTSGWADFRVLEVLYISYNTGTRAYLIYTHCAVRPWEKHSCLSVL